MSEAIICDRCGHAFSKQNNTQFSTDIFRLASKDMYGVIAPIFEKYYISGSIIASVDICTECAKDFAKYWKKVNEI